MAFSRLVSCEAAALRGRECFVAFSFTEPRDPTLAESALELDEDRRTS